MNLTDAGFGGLARRTRGLCEHVALVFDGGYTLETLPGFFRGVAEAF